MRKAGIFLLGAFLSGASMLGQNQPIVMHIVKVTNRPEGGYLAEAKTKTTYYYLSCSVGNAECLHLHAGHDYEGRIMSLPNGLQQFLPTDAPKIPTQMNGTSTQYSVGYNIDGEAEIQPCGTPAQAIKPGQ
jgi:hypothetical protein